MSMGCERGNVFYRRALILPFSLNPREIEGERQEELVGRGIRLRTSTME
jgi:hypothetical protein